MDVAATTDSALATDADTVAVGVCDGEGATGFGVRLLVELALTDIAAAAD